MTLLQGVFIGIINALGGLARIVTPIWSKYSYVYAYMVLHAKGFVLTYMLHSLIVCAYLSIAFLSLPVSSFFCEMPQLEVPQQSVIVSTSLPQFVCMYVMSHTTMTGNGGQWEDPISTNSDSHDFSHLLAL